MSTASMPGVADLEDIPLDYYTSTPSKTSGFDALYANVELAAQETAVGALYRWYGMKKLESASSEDPKLSPEELNERFSGLEVPFTEAKSLKVAEEVYRRNKEKQSLQAIIDNGPQSFSFGVAKFVTAMAPHMIDPLEMGAGIATGYTIGAVAARTAVGARAAASPLAKTVFGAGSASKTLAQEIAGGAAEGFLGNIATEPINVFAAESEQMSYTYQDAAYNAALGAVAFTTVKSAGGRAIRFIRNLGEKPAKMQAEVAHAQVMKSQVVELEPINKMLVRQTDVPPEVSGHIHKNLEDIDIQNTTFHAPKLQVTDDIMADNAMFSDYFGDGIYLTDNHAVASAASSRGFDSVNGSVHEVKISPDAKILNTDDPNMILPGAPLRLAMEKAAIEMESVIPKDARGSFQDIVDNLDIKDKDLFLIKTGLNAKEAGFDGYRFVVSSVAGVDHTPHNGMVIFNPDKIIQTNIREADPNMVQQMTPEELRQMAQDFNSVEKHMDYDQKTQNIVNQNIENPQVRDLKPAEINRLADEQFKAIEDLDRMGLLHPSDKAIMERLKGENDILKDIDETAKALATCLRNNG